MRVSDVLQLCEGEVGLLSFAAFGDSCADLLLSHRTGHAREVAQDLLRRRLYVLGGGRGTPFF